MYTKALYRGCRCIELDIWDGGKDEFTGTPIPIVYHGYTMVSKILFEDILKAIQVFLMLHPKTYPIILSLENHCSVPYQQTVALQLKSILGEKLLYVPEESSLLGPLPSPLQLRGKVVLKGRRPVGANDDYDTDDDAADDDMTDLQSIRTERTSVTVSVKYELCSLMPIYITWHYPLIYSCHITEKHKQVSEDCTRTSETDAVPRNEIQDLAEQHRGLDPPHALIQRK